MAGDFIITPSMATGFCIFHTILYVGILYLSPSTRPRRPINPSDAYRHEDPNYIRLRIRAVTFATIFSVFITFGAIKYATGATLFQAGTLMGLWPANGLWSWAGECGRVLLLVGWLFIGSLWEKFVVSGGWRAEELRSDWQWLNEWSGWRNLVAGPVTEEFVFRAAMVPLQILAGKEFSWIVWTTPLFFGIGHLHHLYEFLLRNPTRLLIGIVRTIFQFTYTTMFGWFATFVFLRTGSVWTVILIHALCNYIGVPNFGRIHDQGDNKPKWEQWVDWVHWAGHVVGLWGFWKGLWWLTEGESPLLQVGAQKLAI